MLPPGVDHRLNRRASLSSTEASHMSRTGNEPVKPGKAVGAREMAEMPKTVGPTEAV